MLRIIAPFDCPIRSAAAILVQKALLTNVTLMKQNGNYIYLSIRNTNLTVTKKKMHEASARVTRLLLRVVHSCKSLDFPTSTKTKIPSPNIETIRLKVVHACLHSCLFVLSCQNAEQRENG